MFSFLFFQRETTVMTSLLHTWVMEIFQIGIFSNRKEFALRRETSFLLELIPSDEIGKKNIYYITKHITYII